MNAVRRFIRKFLWVIDPCPIPSRLDRQDGVGGLYPGHGAVTTRKP